MKTRSSHPTAGVVPFSRVRTAGFLACVPAAALLLASCAGTAPPAPPPPPTPTPAAAQAAPAPEATGEVVRVTGSSLNIRTAPSSTARTIARLPRGSRLEKRGESDGWVQVALADGRTGWVSGRFVAADLPCPPDSTGPELLSTAPVSFAEGSGHGRVVLEATVSETGEVSTVTVKENSTGSPDLASAAGDELRAMRFKPYVRGCRAVPFVYVYTRNY
jgi:TonB family protein